MRHLRRLGAALCMVLPTFACGGGEAPEPAAEPVLDSADVPVVNNPAPDWNTLTRWQVGETPVAEIGGGATPDEQLLGVSGALLLPDGGVAVSSYASHDVRYFDEGGRFVRSVGGPNDADAGRLQAPMLVGTFGGDSLLVTDPQQRRAFVLTVRGELVRDFGLADGDSIALPVAIGVLGNGRVLIYEGPDFSASPPTTGVRRVPAPVHLASREGRIEKLLGEFAGGEVSYLLAGPRLTASSVAFSSDFFLSARGDVLAAGNSDSLDVRFYDGAGNLRRIVRQQREPVPVAEGHFERVMAEALAREQVTMNRNLAEQRYYNMPRRESYPAFSTFRLDAALNLWVEEYKTPDRPGSRWQVFDPGGQLIAFVDLPSDVSVLDIGEDVVLGLVRGPSGDQLRLYRLDRGP